MSTDMICNGIWKYKSQNIKKPFYFRTQGNIRSFKTEREARIARCVHLAIRSLLKNRYDSLSLDEKRKENIQKYGNSCKMEREFARELKDMLRKLFPDIEVIILNDGTRADLLLQRPNGLFLQAQLKTTSGPVKYQNNCWQFSDVLGYSGMPVLCWRNDQQNGWLYDGGALDERGRNDLKVTPDFSNEKKAMHKGALKMDEICIFLVNTMGKFPSVDKITASWDFSGKSISMFKERVAIEIWRIYFDSKASFPDDQNGSYDLLSENTRLQFKTARQHRSGGNALKVDLRESSGMVDGRKTYRPYSSGSFDAVVVIFLDWKYHKAHIWKIPEDILIHKELLITEKCKGRQNLDVYNPDAKHTLRLQKSGEPYADTWTYDFFIGTKDMPKFGIKAETVAAKFFAKCRNSNSH